jgi:hypothetical protein
MSELPHPDDIAAREALANRPQPPLHKLLEQVEAARKWHCAQISPWIPADKELPGNARCVLATDMEAHFIAVYFNDVWTNAHTSEEIDSVITHWMELPEVPE